MRLQYLGCRELGHGFVEHQVRLAGPAGAQAALVQGARRPSGQPRALGAKFAAGAKAAVRDEVRGCRGTATRVGFDDFRVMDELLALSAAGAAGGAARCEACAAAACSTGRGRRTACKSVCLPHSRSCTQEGCHHDGRCLLVGSRAGSVLPR